MENNELTVLDGAPTPSVTGGFEDSLKRSNSKIKLDRALAITKSADLYYKRMVEDKIVELDAVITERENALDLSPTDVNTLIMASDFKAVEFAERDHKLSVKIRNLGIEVDVAKARYKQLFGKDL